MDLDTGEAMAVPARVDGSKVCDSVVDFVWANRTYVSQEICVG